MNMLIEGSALILVVAGTLLFTAGTVGLIRFPDVANRLHALTKADNLGLGLVLAGVALLLGSWRAMVVLALIWLMALAAASISARVLAGLAADSSPLEDNDGAQPAPGKPENRVGPGQVGSG